MGGYELEDAICKVVSDTAGAKAVSVLYRLSPEHKYPGPINDCYEGLRWCISNHDQLNIDPNRVILGGSSAGGNLTAALSLKCKQDGEKGIIGQILNIPVTCHPKHFPAPTEEVKYTSYDKNKDSIIVNSENMHFFWDQYYPEAGRDPIASPLLADSLKGLPPACKFHI